MDKLATPQQIARIVQMFASNQLPFDATQKFIQTHSKKHRRAAEIDPHLLDHHLYGWKKSFPGKGKAIMNILSPYYGWKPELKGALLDLEERAKNVVFWPNVNGLRVFRLCEAASLEASLFYSLSSSRRYEFGDELSDSLRNQLVASLANRLWVSIGESLGNEFYSIGESLWGSIKASLLDSLFYPCANTLAGKSKEAAKFKPLLDLWLAGNFPVGFDKEGNLLVLVAD